MSDVEDYVQVGAPAAHASEHESGGADEIDITGLTPSDHAPRHENGGDDEIDVTGLEGAGCLVFNSIQWFESLSLGSNVITSVDKDLSVLVLAARDYHSSAVYSTWMARLTTNTNIEVDYLKDCELGVFVLEFKSGVLPIQRGVITFGANDQTKAQAINEIVIANSVILQGGFGGSVSADWRRATGRVKITGTTEVTAERHIVAQTYSIDVAYEVLEFE